MTKFEIEEKIVAMLKNRIRPGDSGERIRLRANL